MLNKRLGIFIIIISVAIAVIIFSIMAKLGTLGTELGCYPSASDCLRIENYFSISHIALGVIAFLFALGVYLVFFSRGEEAVLKRLETDASQKLSDEKFNILLKGLDVYEKKILKVVREQPGITQDNLKWKVDLSKAKASQVLTQLENKKLIKRVKKKKTYAIYFLENF